MHSIKQKVHWQLPFTYHKDEYAASGTADNKFDTGEQSSTNSRSTSSTPQSNAYAIEAHSLLASTAQTNAAHDSLNGIQENSVLLTNDSVQVTSTPSQASIASTAKHSSVNPDKLSTTNSPSTPSLTETVLPGPDIYYAWSPDDRPQLRSLVSPLYIVYDFGAGGCSSWSIEGTLMLVALYDFLSPYTQRLALIPPYGLFEGMSQFCSGLEGRKLQILEELMFRDVSEWPQVDIFISHKAPPAFPTFPYNGIEQKPKYFIGRSMTEVNHFPKHWLPIIHQRAQELWLPSSHIAPFFLDHGVNPNITKVFVIHEPFHDEMSDTQQIVPVSDMDGLRKFNFLSIFKMEPRKGWDHLLQAFIQEFRQDDDVALWILTYLFNEPGIDARNPWRINQKIERVVQEIESSLPAEQKKMHIGFDRIHVLSDEIPTELMPTLYATMQAFVLLTHGEGFGLPLLEAMAMGLPTIATNWSGQLDFMFEDHAFLIPLVSENGGMVECDQSDWDSGSLWAMPSIPAAQNVMRALVQNPQKARAVGLRSKKFVQKYFSTQAIAHRMASRLAQIAQEQRLGSFVAAP